jgi:acetoacetyl-CoA reductase
MAKRTALVTGGTRGLGEAIAQRLFDDGCDVIVTHTLGNANSDDWLEAQKADGRTFVAHPVDVADAVSCAALADRLQADGRIVDILVNNAGITRDATFKKLTLEDWNAVLRTNLDSMFNMTKPFAEPMAQRGWGRIINIASINGQKGSFGQTNYAAAKAGIHGFSMSLAQELARKGVTVNTVSPGYLATQMVMQVPKEVLEEKIVSQIPIGRLGEPREIAALVAFIASPEGAYMTGANLAMNGGHHMQ